jgi:hypothetical protein
MLPKNRKIKGEKYKRMNLSIKRHRSFFSLRFQDDVIIFKKKKKKKTKQDNHMYKAPLGSGTSNQKV